MVFVEETVPVEFSQILEAVHRDTEEQKHEIEDISLVGDVQKFVKINVMNLTNITEL